MADLDYFRKRFATFKTIEEEEEELKKKKSPLDYFSQKITAPVDDAPEYPGASVEEWKIDEVAKAYKYAIEQSDNPLEMEDRFNTAYYLAKTKGIGFTEAFENTESILQADYGKALSPKSGLEAVLNVWKAQTINREISKYTYDLKNKALSGQYKTMDELMSDPLYQQVKMLEYQLPPDDVIKRDWPVNALKSVMQIVPSYTESLLKGATAGMIAQIGATALLGAAKGAVVGSVGLPGAGTIAGAAGGALIAVVPTIAKLAGATFSAVAVGKNTQEMEGGAAFYDMIKFRDPVTGQSINPLIAAKWTTAYEGLASAVEMSQADTFFAPLRNGLNVAQVRAVKEAVKASANSVADASARAGILLKIAHTTAGKWFLEWGGSVASETLEEDLQEGLQIWATESAKLMTNRLDGTSLSPASKEEIVKRLVDTTVGSVIGMGLLQAGPASFSIWADTKATQAEAKAEANKPSITPITPETKPVEIQAEKPEPLPMVFKSTEPSPGIVEIHGTTQAEGANRKATIISVLNVNDEEKTATVSSISWSKEVRSNPDEALRQGIEILKNAKSELHGYTMLFQPTTKIQKAVKDAIESNDPKFFNPVGIEPATAPEAKTEENVAPPKENSVALQQKAPDENKTDEAETLGVVSTQKQEEANKNPVIPESTSDEFEEQDSLGTLQREGAQRIQTKLDDEGYKYTDEKHFDVDKIQFHPDLPNFKEGANKEGVVNPIKGKPEPLGMPPIIVFHTLDDKYYMVTGRHRLDLWRRNNLPTIPAQVLHEKDGYTLDDMAVLDAEMNIRDNQGTERDYAKYFGRVKYTYERAEGRGLLRTGKSKSGFYIGTFASPALRSLFYSNRISADKAAAIAEAAPNDEGLQAVGIKLASDKTNTPEVIKNALAMFASTRSGSKSEQLEMFGTDSSALDAQVKIAKGAESIKNEITGELSVLKQAARLGDKDRARFVEKYGYKVGDTVSLSARIEELSYLATKWEGISWSSDPDLFFQAKLKAGLATEEEIAAHAPAEPATQEQVESLFENSPEYASNYEKLKKIAEDSKDVSDFRRKLTQKHLMDLSNPELHRFGRAVPGYPDEPFVDISDIQDNKGNSKGLLETFRYESEAIYRAINNGKDTVTVYRAIPKTGDPEQEVIHVDDFVTLDRDYARKHGEAVLKGEQGVKYKIVSMVVPKKDVVWGEADVSEWAYSPRELREKVPSMEAFYIKLKNNEPINENLLREKEQSYASGTQNVSPWKYKADEIVQQKIKGVMPGRQILKTLQANGVKQDELRWTGLDDYLDTDEKRTPQEVIKFIDENKLQIQELNKQENEMSLAEIARSDIDETGVSRQTLYSKYTLPGGENYREILFTLPRDNSGAFANKNIGQFKSNHWDEKNVVAHARADDRILPEGKRALFIEEIQSDWHQKGRRFGYHNDIDAYMLQKFGDSYTQWKKNKELRSYAREKVNIDGHVLSFNVFFPDEITLWLKNEKDSWAVTIKKGNSEYSDIYENVINSTEYKNFIEKLKEYKNLSFETESAIEVAVGKKNSELAPPAPFQKTWHEFVFKRMLKDAVENGYDYMAWTTGDQQASRYDLSKHISEIAYWNLGEDLWGISVLDDSGSSIDIFNNEAVSTSDIERYFGKEIAKKIINDEGKLSLRKAGSYGEPVNFAPKIKVLHEKDVVVGGDGMRGFYDKILVEFANKYGAKWGSQVIDLAVPAQVEHKPDYEDPDAPEYCVTYCKGKLEKKEYFDNIEKAQRFARKVAYTVHAIPITDQMRSAVPEGQYLFEKSENKYGLSVDKSEYRKQIIKANEITKLIADNLDSFFNDDVKNFIINNNNALISALENAKTENVSFQSTAENGKYSATLVPAKDGSRSWDINLYIDEELVGVERYKDRTSAIVGLFTDTAPLFGGTESWKVTTPEHENQLTPDQMGDMAQKEENQLELFEYDDKTITLIYGSKKEYEKANKSLQLDLFGQSDPGDLFAYRSEIPNDGTKNNDGARNYRRRTTAVSSLLGPSGKSLHPQVKENRKGQRRVSFVGQTISGPRDIAELFQVYRNSTIESFHFIYLDDTGKIIAHNAMSSGVAGRTIAFEFKYSLSGSEKNLYYMQERMKRLGATQVYLMHNHPSGDPLPSTNDIHVTAEYIKIFGDAFKAHIVLDHDVARVIDNELMKNGDTNSFSGVAQLTYRAPEIHYTPNSDSYKPASGNKIDSPDTAAKYALSAMNDRTGGTLIITDYHLRILEWRVWNNINPKAIYQAVKESGGSRAFFATDDLVQYNAAKLKAIDTRGDGGKYNVYQDIMFINKERGSFTSAFSEISQIPDHYTYLIGRGYDRTHIGKYVMEPLVEEASEFDSYQEFKDAYLAEGEGEEEIKKAWVESQQKKGPASSDEEFITFLQDREKLMNFLMANGADLYDRKVPRKNLSVVDATSYRLATGGEVSPATISRTQALIEKYASRWRARYQELIGMKPETEQEDFEISGSAPDISILQARHKEAIENLPENLKANDAYKNVKDSAEKLSERTMKIRNKLEQSKKDLKEYEERFSYAEKRIVDMQRQVRDLDKKIWAERAKSRLNGRDNEKLREMEEHKKDLEAQIIERTSALSPQAAMKNAAYLAKKEAIKKTTKELKEKQALEKAKRAERDLKIYYATKITRPVSKGVDFKVGLEIKKLQALVDPYFRRLAEGKEVGPFTSPAGKPLNLWNLEDLQMLYEEIEGLRDLGRTIYQTKIMEQSSKRSKIRMKLQETALKTGKERPAYYYGTRENAEQMRKDKGIFKGFDLSLETIHRVAKELDGGREGAFYKTIVEGEREAFRNEKDNFDRRIAGIEEKMAELGLDRDAMYLDKVALGDQTISKWETIALYIGSQNARTEAAIVYGNMMTQDDRENLTDEEFYDKALQNRQYIKEAISTLRPEEIELANYLIKDGENEFDRIAEATYTYENRIPEKEGVYFPHERKMRSGEGDTPEEVIDQVMARAAKAQRSVGKQPTINRIEIGPRHQSPISLDAYQVYRRGIERQEHYIAYARYISDMNSVWKNARGAAGFREKLRLYHGQGVLDYVDRWISEAANPKAFADFNKPTAGIDRVFKTLRGPLGVAYLGYRASRGVFQLITSPAPFLPYAGHFMIARMVKNLNPAEFMRTLSFAKQHSAFIRHRVINPTDAYIKQYLDKTPDKLKRNAMAAAGAIMEWSDLWSVSTGWMAVYEKKIVELKDSSMTEEEIMKEAIKEADKVMIETQPTYRHQDLSPAFKKDSELERFLFQFQTPLNVIYNQLFHDTKNEWRSGHKGRSIAIVAGYLSVMGLMAVLTAPKDDDDDETKKAKQFLAGAASVPLETIPFVGSMAAGYVESLITGDRFYRDDQIFPGVKKVFDGARMMATSEDQEKRIAAFIKLMEGSGMLVGVPTSAIKEYYRVIFEGDWGALIGRRKGD